ncbi:hypothetical protein DMC30DRAFT_419507 [Rhodotorula diobovata]|uniref:Uncharacterized protein n=1 Tax=Rhodotorula diobovata TaxID=5288 RepID=A0A5C5FLS8_9BASI|nr:hypothetical protein DMC30DRAFT_419507 [Rhodotorula diobovata]
MTAPAFDPLRVGHLPDSFLPSHHLDPLSAHHVLVLSSHQADSYRPQDLFSSQPHQSPYPGSSHGEQYAPARPFLHDPPTTPYPHPHPHSPPPRHPDAHGPNSLAHEAPRPRISQHYAQRYYSTTAAEWGAERAFGSQ